jgi:hypothetical protein
LDRLGQPASRRENQVEGGPLTPAFEIPLDWQPPEDLGGDVATI